MCLQRKCIPCRLMKQISPLLTYQEIYKGLKNATIAESICWSLLLDGCIHTSKLIFYTLYYGWLRPYHMFMYQRYQFYLYLQDFRWWCLVWTHSHKAFHSSLSLGPHALGGIYYTAFCHCPCNPQLAHWRVISVTNAQCHALKITFLHLVWWRQSSSCWHFLKQSCGNPYCCLGMSSPLSPHTDLGILH